MRKLFYIGVLLTIIFTNSAQAFEVSEPIQSSVVITNRNLSTMSNSLKKDVYLMNIKLTPKQKQTLMETRAKNTLSQMNAAHQSLPMRVELGMNGVPVLDQGKHGTCVTFAVTGAIDAILGKGDYISQLCNLELGTYLDRRGYYKLSGWDGFTGPFALNQILQFGIINKVKQKTKSCAGVTEYPLNSEYNHGKPMSLDEFKSKSEDMFVKIYWEPILDYFQSINIDPAHPYDADQTFLQVKQALAAAQNTVNPMRIVFGSFLPVGHCGPGACARYHENQDTWALTQAIMNDPDSWFKAGHEMIITGYDDNAVAIDNEGQKHTGLFILRNSWGNDVGDQGNYYMTYDFFKKFVIEVQEIIATE